MVSLKPEDDFREQGKAMSKLRNKAIAVTGAGSGIGRALALRLAECGAHLALADRDPIGLDATGRLLGGRSRVLLRCFDVAEPGALQQFAEDALVTLGQVHGIINNAGLTVVAPFTGMPRADFDRVMAVNFGAVVEGTRAFLPLLQDAGEGWIVNISSVLGMIAYPTQSAYNASKFAVRGFTECLRLELAQSDPGIQVMCVHPGGIKTNIARNAKILSGGNDADTVDRFDAMCRTTAEGAADAIVRGMERGAERVLIGPDAHLIELISRLFPVRYFNVLGRMFG